MKSMLTFLLWAGVFSLLVAQEKNYPVVAEQGDGIFSILRKQGLDPVKYYEEFIILNAKNIKDGSKLQVGKEYLIPMALDSFKKTGVRIGSSEKKESPIFNSELSTMSHKSSKLVDAIYYLIPEAKSTNNNDFVNEITKNLAAELLVHGAKVFIIGSDSMDKKADVLSTELDKMGWYVETINKHYLQHSGKYQRLLIIEANGLIAEGDVKVAVYHHAKSDQGQRFANNIQNIFKKHSVSNSSFEDVDMIFKDKHSLYLAKNTLPAVSLLMIENNSKYSGKGVISVRSDKESFSDLIANGILKDYADLEIED